MNNCPAIPSRRARPRRRFAGPARGLRTAVFLSLFAAGPLRAAEAPPDPAAVSGERALAEVKAFVALGPRDAGTDGARRAAEHLRRRLTDLGVKAEIDEFKDETPAGPVVFRNVIGRVPGRGRGVILLGSHYDTKSGIPNFEGANDSGSSTGLLLELARVAAAGPPPPCDLWFVFFDGEESRVAYGPRDGFHGSRHLARRLVQEGRKADVRGVLVLDMIGDRDLSVTLPRNATPSVLTSIFEAARAEGIRSKFKLVDTILDDHEPFRLAGFPAGVIIDFEYGSRPGRNDYWHTAEDRMDKLSAESLAQIGRVALRVVRGWMTAPPAAGAGGT